MERKFPRAPTIHCPRCNARLRIRVVNVKKGRRTGYCWRCKDTYGPEAMAAFIAEKQRKTPNAKTEASA